MQGTNISTNIAAATAVVLYDCFTGELAARQPFARKIEKVGVVGSAAIGDFEVELRVNGQAVGKFQNTTAGVGASNPGAVAMDKDMKTVDIYVPPNALLQAIVTDAPATNAVKVEVHFGTPRATGRSYGSGGYRRSSYGGRRTSRRSAGSKNTGGMY